MPAHQGLALPQVLILAAGAGTRLRPFTLTQPKTLLPVCNISILGRLLAQLVDAGFKTARLLLPELDHDPVPAALAVVPRTFTLEVSVARRPFSGTVSAALELTDPAVQTTLVIYGDSLLACDFAQ